jgi:hypothetical protein
VSLDPGASVATPGSTGNILTVRLTNFTNLPPGPFDLGGFNVTLSVPAASGITFTGGDSSVTNYVLLGNSFGFGFTNPSGLNTADISDLTNVGTVNIPISSSFNLGRLFYNVDAGATLGVSPVTFSGATSFIDGSFANIPFSTVAGSIEVSPSNSNAVPLPASVFMFGFGAVSMIYAHRRRALI